MKYVQSIIPDEVYKKLKLYFPLRGSIKSIIRLQLEQLIKTIEEDKEVKKDDGNI